MKVISFTHECEIRRHMWNMYQTKWHQIPDVSNLIQGSTNLVTVPGIFQSTYIVYACSFFWKKKSQLTNPAIELTYNNEKIRHQNLCLVVSCNHMYFSGWSVDKHFICGATDWCKVRLVAWLCDSGQSKSITYIIYTWKIVLLKNIRLVFSSKENLPSPVLMYLIISMFIADGFILCSVFQLDMDDGNIFPDKMSPHQKALAIHLLADFLFQCPYTNCLYTVMSSPSVSTFLFCGTFSIYMPYLCMYSIWFVSWKGKRRSWTKLIYYSTTRTTEAVGSSDTLEPIYKITYLRKPQT